MKTITILFFYVLTCYSLHAQNILELSKDIANLDVNKIKKLIKGLDNKNIELLNKQIIDSVTSEYKSKIKSDIQKQLLDSIRNYPDSVLNIYINAKIDEYVKSHPLDTNTFIKYTEFKGLEGEEEKFLKDLKNLLENKSGEDFAYDIAQVIFFLKNIEVKRQIFEINYKLNTNNFNNLDKLVKDNLNDVNDNIQGIQLVNNQSIYNSNISLTMNIPPVRSSNIYEALGEFLVERFKYEFSASIVNELIFKDKSLEGKLMISLFPLTSALVKTFDKNPDLISLELLKLKFKEDLENLPDKIINYLGPDGINFIKNKEVISDLEIFKDFSKQILRGKSSIDLLSTLIENSNLSNGYYKSINNLQNTYNVINKYFRKDERGIVKWNYLPDYNTLERKIIFILLRNELIKKYDIVWEIEHDEHNNFLAINKLLESLNNTQFYISSLQNGNTNYLAYINESINLIKSSYNLYKKNTNQSDANLSTIFQNDYLKYIFKILLHLERKEYIDAISETYLFTININESNIKNKDTLKTMYKYLRFAAQLSSANSNEELKAAIENFVLPPLSIKQKRQACWDISLIGSPGFYFGHERYENSENNKYKINSSGISAPIGIDVGIGIGKSWTLSLFAPVIDLGAIFKYNFEPTIKDSIDYSNFSFTNFFSPGIFFRIGIGWLETPLALGFGAQYLPKFRSIKNGINDIKENTWIYSVTLSWDIALFRFGGSKDF